MDHHRPAAPRRANPLSSALPTLLSLASLGWSTLLAATADRRRPGAVAQHPGHGERGDVPGWVMITLMTAGLVVALWAVAGDRLAALFTQAMDAVTKVL